MSTQLSADIAQNKMYAPRFKAKAAEEQQQQQQQQQAVKPEASLSNVQWVQQQNAAAQTNNVNPTQDTAKTDAVNNQKPDVQVAGLGDEDLAVMSSKVSLNAKSVASAKGKGFHMASFLGLDASQLEESYRKYFKESRSHNLLLERFMSHVKFSGIKTLCSMLGVSLEEQVQIQAEVRQEALAEIDTKLKNDWAYSQALLEVVS